MSFQKRVVNAGLNARNRIVAAADADREAKVSSPEGQERQRMHRLLDQFSYRNGDEYVRQEEFGGSREGVKARNILLAKIGAKIKSFGGCFFIDDKNSDCIQVTQAKKPREGWVLSVPVDRYIELCKQWGFDCSKQLPRRILNAGSQTQEGHLVGR